VQLAGTLVSLTPLHSVTASALFTSLLSLHNNTWGVLSEGIIIILLTPNVVDQVVAQGLFGLTYLSLSIGRTYENCI